MSDTMKVDNYGGITITTGTTTILVQTIAPGAKEKTPLLQSIIMDMSDEAESRKALDDAVGELVRWTFPDEEDRDRILLERKKVFSVRKLPRKYIEERDHDKSKCGICRSHVKVTFPNTLVVNNLMAERIRGYQGYWSLPCCDSCAESIDPGVVKALERRNRRSRERRIRKLLSVDGQLLRKKRNGGYYVVSTDTTSVFGPELKSLDELEMHYANDTSQTGG